MWSTRLRVIVSQCERNLLRSRLAPLLLLRLRRPQESQPSRLAGGTLGWRHVSAVAVQVKGLPFSLYWLTKLPILVVSSFTLVNDPRQIALSVMIVKNRST